MRLLASTFGPDQGRAAALGAQHVPIEALLRESDIVSLHLRLSADTQGYLGKERLAMRSRRHTCLILPALILPAAAWRTNRPGSSSAR